jgi:hypothetical protein
LATISALISSAILALLTVGGRRSGTAPAPYQGLPLSNHGRRLEPARRQFAILYRTEEVSVAKKSRKRKARKKKPANHGKRPTAS